MQPRDGIMEGATVMDEEVGFQVTDEVQVGDLSHVKEDQSIPAAKGVGFRIKKASRRDIREDNTKEAPKDSSNPIIKKLLSLEVRITEAGIEGKYVNKPFFVDLIIWVDTTHKFYASDKYQSETKGYLNDFKRLMEALGYDLKSPPAINDALLAELASR